MSALERSAILITNFGLGCPASARPQQDFSSLASLGISFARFVSTPVIRRTSWHIGRRQYHLRQFGTMISSMPIVPTITDRSPCASDSSATKLQWRSFSRVSASGCILAMSAGFSLIEGWPDTVRMVARSASLRSAKLSGCSAIAWPERSLARRRMASLIEAASASLSTAVSSEIRAVAASKAWTARSSCAEASARPAARPSSVPLCDLRQNPRGGPLQDLRRGPPQNQPEMWSTGFPLRYHHLCTCPLRSHCPGSWHHPLSLPQHALHQMHRLNSIRPIANFCIEFVA